MSVGTTVTLSPSAGECLGLTSDLQAARRRLEEVEKENLHVSEELTRREKVCLALVSLSCHRLSSPLPPPLLVAVLAV